MRARSAATCAKGALPVLASRPGKHLLRTAALRCGEWAEALKRLLRTGTLGRGEGKKALKRSLRTGALGRGEGP